MVLLNPRPPWCAAGVPPAASALSGDALFLLAGVCLAGFLLWRTASRRNGRIRRIRETLEDMSHGLLRSRVYDSSPDEIGELARAVNALGTFVEEQIDHSCNESRKLGSIIDGMIEGVLAVSGTDKLLLLNAAAERMLGLRSEAVAGCYFWQVLRIPAVLELVEFCRTREAPMTREITLASPGQRDRILEVHASKLEFEGSTRPGAVLVLHDISTLRRLETARKDFVANASHELKTPLMALRGFLETIRTDGDMPEETRNRFLERMSGNCDRLDALVDSLLQLTRMESPEAQGPFRPVDFGKVAEESHRGFREEAEKKGIDLELMIPPGDLEIPGDEEALRCMLDNLLSNAVRYTDPGGWVRLSASEEGDFLTVTVEDSGIGIPPEHLPRIFERFFRVDPARSRGLGGSGLGLSIVKHVADLHGGTVDCESRPGEGSRFLVRLPRTSGRNRTASDCVQPKRPEM